ncbi:unnamed protein product [Didymodactylos carnosus]|nr:unnamed protein product [Didymodactylos carnosus]CAF4313689.1 unnamed protein product [Didymodactylos carnosus]
MLRGINDFVLFYTDYKQCSAYIESARNESVFIIVSGFNAKDFFRYVPGSSNVESIFIFCGNDKSYSYLKEQHTKIVGIYTDQKPLIAELKNKLSAHNKKQSKLSLVQLIDKNKPKTTCGVATNTSNFIKSYLAESILSKMISTPESKKDLIDYCTEYYQGNPSGLSKITDFDENYRSSDAIKWYTKNTFLYRLINKAFRSQNYQLLYIFRYFIIDLSHALRLEWERSKNVRSLYRGQIMSKDEYLTLLDRQIIKMNGYVSTTRNQNVAKMFAGVYHAQDDSCQSVLFEYEVDNNSGITVADISDLSELTDEDECLFDVNATFEITDHHEITEYNEEYAIIRLKTKSYAVNDANIHLEFFYSESYDLSAAFSFDPFDRGDLNLGDEIIKMDKLSKRLNYYEYYILNNYPVDFPDHYKLGCGYCLKEEAFQNGPLDVNDRTRDGLWENMYDHALYHFQSCRQQVMFRFK